MLSIDFLLKTQVLLKLPKVHAQRTHGRNSWDRLGGGTGWKLMMLRRAGGGLWMPVCGILRYEVLNAEWFHSIKQAQVAINVRLKEYNHIRPHHALGMRPPAPETLLEKIKISGTEKWG